MKRLFVILIGGLFLSQAQAVEVKKVKFKSHGDKLIGNLYLPDDYNRNSKLPGVVVTGAWTTVKEQMPETYATELAEKGYAALTFDFRGWGKSKGNPRYLEDPIRKTEDIIEAIDYLSTRKEVDSSKLAGLGVCASSGYMLGAYTKSKKLKSVAVVAPWLHDREIAEQVYGGKEGVKNLIAISEKAEKEYTKTGKIQTAVAASTTDKTSIMFKAPYYTEKDRGLIKEYDNKFNLASWKPWLTYDAMQYAPQLPSSVLFVGSEAMALPQGAKKFKGLSRGKVETVWLDGINQFQFYDQRDAVKKATKSADDYFRKSLK